MLSISGLLWNYDAMPQNKASLNYLAASAGLIKTQAMTHKHLCLQNGLGHSPTRTLKLLLPNRIGRDFPDVELILVKKKNDNGIERKVLENWSRRRRKWSGWQGGRKKSSNLTVDANSSILWDPPGSENYWKWQQWMFPELLFIKRWWNPDICVMATDSAFQEQCACAHLAQSCLLLCDPMDCTLPGSSVHGISQPKILQWVAISFSRASSQPRDGTRVSFIGRWILYHWPTRKAHSKHYLYEIK